MLLISTEGSSPGLGSGRPSMTTGIVSPLPLSADARTTRITCLLAAGHKEEARAEFARLEALAPPNLRELQIRFERQLK